MRWWGNISTVMNALIIWNTQMRLFEGIIWCINKPSIYDWKRAKGLEIVYHQKAVFLIKKESNTWIV